MNLPFLSITLTGIVTSVVFTRTTSPSPTSSGSLLVGAEDCCFCDEEGLRLLEEMVVPVCSTGRFCVGCVCAGCCCSSGSVGCSVVCGFAAVFPTRRGRVCA